MNKNNDNKKTNPAAATIVGAVIGAGIAVAANKVLSDPKKREQLKKTAVHVKGEVEKALKNVKENATDTKEQIEKKVEERTK